MEITYDELLQRVKSKFINNEQGATECVTTEAMLRKSLISVVELHKPKNYIIKGFEVTESWCTADSESLTPYPCATIQAIAKELP